ncbi:hypothetical protein EPO14_01115 [Patescibacteria group bacterium]|nr:MAG: hypothetical protein EPO14_01115 [Patescibacteria group bacterium]
MNNETDRAMFDALIGQDVALAPSRSVALHLAKVALYEEKGVFALHPNIKPLLDSLLIDVGKLKLKAQVVSTFRTFAKQNALYAQGRTIPGSKVTNAMGGQSYHNYGLAFDLVVYKEDGREADKTDYTHVGVCGERLGLEWGGNFDDFGHFEYHPGFSWHELINQFKI